VYILIVLGTVFSCTGDITTAIDVVTRALNLASEINSVYSEVSSMQALTALYITQKEYDTALEWCQKSIEKNKKMGNREIEAWSLWAMGDIYFFKKDYSAALKCYDQTLDISREFGIDNLEGYVLKSIGLTYGNIGELSQAVENTRQGISKFQALGDRYSLGLSYYDLALWYSEQSNDSLATMNYANAIDVIEDIRGSLETEAFRTGYAEKSIDAYVGMIGSLIDLNKTVDAFEYMERSRARSFLDLIGSGDVTVGKSRHAEFLLKEEEYYQHEEKMDQQIAAADDDTVQIAMLRGKLEEEWESIDALIEEKKMYEPELASMVTVNPLTLPEVQELVDPKSTILEYFLTDEKTMIWLLTRDNMEVFQVAVGGDSIATLVKDYRDAILTEGMVEERSQALYEILIAPAEDRIETKQLIIIPHGILHYLPFPALQDKKGKYLIDRYEISYLPSASVLKYLEPKKRPKGETLLAFGNPTTNREGYDPIPFAEGEVDAIADFYEEPLLYTREDATEDKFRELAPDYDIIHLACHSELNSAYPLFSGLLLAPGEEQDGELDVHELFTMDLNAYLVVLSACQTGLGHLTNGDELVGLSRAFIYAGTPSVVSSLWVVKDESTAYLMTEFHKNLRKYDKAEALRRAQLKTKKKYKSPYHWASFVLIGSPD
jgi:CHAT domain-containing protein